MKIFKSILLGLLVIISQTTFAGSKGITGPSTLTLNPSNIKTRVVNDNISVAQGLNSVHQAKDSLNIARGNLLPSLNLGGLLSLAGTGFMLGSIDFLVPFLVPSNWANYYTQRNLFEAEKISFGVIQLNTYSSALSMYYTLLSDLEVQQIFQKQHEDLQGVYEFLERKNQTIPVPLADLLQSQAQAQMAGVRASLISELNVREYSFMRVALALPPDTIMTPEYVDMPSSPWEFEGKDAMIRQVNAVSLERKQIRYLLKAANNQVWSRAFGWINMFTVSSRAAGNRPASFDNLSVTGSVSLGFATFPSIQLAQDRADAIRLQDKSLILQHTQIVESALGSIAEAKEQLDLATQAEEKMARVYQYKLNDYKNGIPPLTAVLLARNQWVDASIARVKANMDINLQRVLIHRAVLTDGFANIKGCHPAHHMPEKQKGPIDWIRRGGKAPKYPNFDDYCRGK